MNRRAQASALLVALLVASLALVPHLEAEPPLRIAITPVLVEHYLEVNRQLISYVGEKLRRPTEIVQRRSYREISDLLERGEIDIAFVCGLPYVLDHDRFGLELLAAPIIYDGPVYFSYVIVPSDSPIERFEDLRGKRYAFSDPLSNSGHLVPLYMLAKLGETPDRFFKRSMFTYSHSASVEAVAVKFVDAASVDSYVYDYLVATNPRLTERTKVILKSPPYGITPLVVRNGIDSSVKTRVQSVLLGMDRDPKGREILSQLMIRRFEAVQDGLFDGIRDMLSFVDRRSPGAVAGRAPVR